MPNVQVFTCLDEAKVALVDVDVYRKPTPVIVNGEIADSLRKRKCFQIGVGFMPATTYCPPTRMAILGAGGRRVAVVPQREVELPHPIVF